MNVVLRCFLVVCLWAAAKGTADLERRILKTEDPQTLRSEADELEEKIKLSKSWSQSPGELLNFGLLWNKANKDVPVKLKSVEAIKKVEKERKDQLNALKDYDRKSNKMSKYELRTKLKEVNSWKFSPEDLEQLAEAWVEVEKDVDKMKSPRYICNEADKRQKIVQTVAAYDTTPEILRKKADEIETSNKIDRNKEILADFKAKGDKDSAKTLDSVVEVLNKCKGATRQFREDHKSLKKDLFSLKYMLKKNRSKEVLGLLIRTNKRRRSISRKCRKNPHSKQCQQTDSKLTGSIRNDTQTTASRLSDMLTETLADYLESLKELQARGAKAADELKKDFDFVESSSTKPEFSALDELFADWLKELKDYQIQMKDANAAVQADATSIQKVLQATVCFEFKGVDGKLISDKDKEKFVKELSVALEIAFADEGLPFDVVNLKIDVQRFVEEDAPRKRGSSSDSEDSSSTRSLRSSKVLRIRVILEFLCNCEPEDPISDVFGRRLTSKNEINVIELTDLIESRELFDKGLQDHFVLQFKETFSEGIFRHVTGITAIPCNQFLLSDGKLDEFLLEGVDVAQP